MKNMVLVLIACAAICPAAEAQVDTAWVRVRDYGHSNGNNVAVDDAGNVYVGGYGDIAGDQGAITVAYDSLGRELWTQYYTGIYHSYPSRIEMHVNGNDDISVLGPVGGNSDAEFCTIRYNSGGDSLWSRLYAGPVQNSAYPRAVVSDDAGNVYAAGSSDGPCWAIVKYDRVGDLIWERIYTGYPDLSAIGVYDIKLDGEGDLVVLGQSIVRQGDGISCVTTAKYDTAGNLLWASRHDSSSIVSDVFMAIDSDDNIFVSVLSDSGSWVHKPLLIKYLPDGDTAWSRIVPGNIYWEGIPFVLAVDSSGNAYISGSQSGAFITLKYSPAGDTLWSRSDGDFESGNYPRDIAMGESGAVYVAGVAADSLGRDFCVLKYSLDGELIWTYRYECSGPYPGYLADLALDSYENIYFTGYNDLKMITVKLVQRPTGIGDEPTPLPAEMNLSAYPNPFNAQTTISYSLSWPGPVILDIFNITGQKVAGLVSGDLQAGEHNVTWDTGGLSSGVYLARLAAMGESETVKMVVLK